MPEFHCPTSAVILAAGLGSRLHPITQRVPKPLVGVNGTPILHNALAHLAALGIDRTILVVGYRKDDIKASCGSHYNGMAIDYVESQVFDCTGSAYSLWLTRDLVRGGDVVLLEGDVFFEKAVLDRLLAEEGDVAAVNLFGDLMSGSAVRLSSKGLVCDYRMNHRATDLAAAGFYKTVNLFRFTASTVSRHLLPTLDALLASGAVTAYVEQVLADLIAQGHLQLRGVVCDDLRWCEIDDPGDLRIAERLFQPATPAFGNGALMAVSSAELRS